MNTQSVRIAALLLIWLAAIGAAQAAGQVEVAEADGDPAPFGDCSGQNAQNCAAETDDVGMGDPDECPGDQGENTVHVGETPGQHVNFAPAGNECGGAGGGYSFQFITEGGYITGLIITHSEGELSALCYREVEPSIGSVRVSIDRYDRVARIEKVPRTTLLNGNASVEVHLNDVPHTFSTLGTRRNASALNDAIYNGLVSLGYEVIDTGDYWVIKSDPAGWGIHAATFVAHDTGIVRSAVSIEPLNDHNYPWCFPPEE